MENEGPIDSLKSLQAICEPDERQRFFVGSIQDYHEELSKIVLNDTVPAGSRQLFETAKNLSLYSWFVYRFHPIAELTGWLALENALLEKAKREGELASDTERSPALRRLLAMACKHSWLQEDRIADRREAARARVQQRKVTEAIVKNVDWVEDVTETEISEEAVNMRLLPQICRAASELRNHLAHGGQMLHPNSRATLRVTADLINQLFPNR